MKNYYYSLKNYLVFLFFIFTTTTFAQGTTCASATTLTIDGSCGSGSISDTTQDTPNASGCSFNTFQREAWYTFTVSGGPLNITVTAEANNRNLFLQLISSTSSCAGLTQIACANADTTNNSLQTETISMSLGNGIYYVKVINNGGNNNMTLNSICVTSSITPSGNFTCATATVLPCATSNLAGTTVGSSNTPHGTACSIANYGAWYTFVGNGQITTISSTAGAGYDHEMSISSGSCGTFTSLACLDSGLSGGIESYTFSTTMGVNYYVYIAHYSSGNTTTGTFTISRTCSAPITNDNCAGAISVPVNPTRTCASTISGTIFGATDSGISGSGCFGNDDDDVWYSFIATSSIHHIELLNVAGSTTDLYHAIYNGGCGSLGAAILCSDPNTSMVTGLTPGNTYYLQIYSWGGTIGQTTTFDICISTDPPCTTPASQATGFTAGTITSTAFPASFSGTADAYLIIRSNSATPPSQPVDGVIYSAANINTLGAGLTFVQSGTSTTITGTGLNGNTRYYYYIYAFNNTSCTGGPLYNILGPLTGNGTTCPVTPSPLTVIPTLTSINFSWPSSLGGGSNAVTYQLQVTTDAGYTANISGSPFTINDPTTTLNVTGLTSNTTYYYRIRANNGCWSSYTTGNTITGYCAYSTTTSTYWISNFNTTGGTTNINRNSTYTAGGYANYSGTDIVSQVLGQSFNFSVTMNSSTHGINIFVDWNNDLDFNDTGEIVYVSGAYVGSATGVITIPGTTSIGNHRMRVVSNYFDSNPTACGTNSYTEAEDYTINVTTPPACSGTPNGGTVTASPNTGWPNAPYLVISSGYTIASDLNFQWQFSTNAGATWTNAGAISSTYADYTATAPISGTVLWQLIVTCLNSGISSTSTVGTFTTMIISDVVTGCPNVVSGGLNLNGADPSPFNCTDVSTCVDLEATYLDLGDTTSYTVEAIQYNPPHNFNGLANPVSVNTDDVWSPTVNLPFNFCFYGNTYNNCLIGSNGVITFDTTNNTSGGSCAWEFDSSDPGQLPINNHPSLIENAIFGVFQDIDPGKGGEVGWELITLPTGCRALVASWYNVPMYSDNSILYTGMMVLYENSNIIEVYVKEKKIDDNNVFPWNDGNAVIGIQNANGTIASVPPGRNGLDTNWTATNEAWRFVPSGPSIASLNWYEGAGTTGPVLGTSPIINVCPAATTTYTAEITYTLCNGTTLKQLDQTTVTVNGAKVWNGSVSTNWNVANNWTPTGVPTAMDCVVIADTANDPIVSGTNFNALGLNLTVNNNATLTGSPTNNITITDWVNINTNGNLVLQNSASLIQINNASINSGSINMERITNVRLQDYSYWSSPVNSFPVTSISPSTPSGLIFEWKTTATNANGGQGTWVNTTENMIPSKGYIVRAPNGYSNASTSPLTANFIGVPNNGVFSPTIFRGNDFTGTGTQGMPRAITDDNWNLIGNPYPSALGVNEFLTLPANNTIVGGIRIWTHGQLPTNGVDPFYQNFATNYYPSDYITINLTGATSGPGDYKIGSGQGFMVLMNPGAAGSSSVTFNNSMRSATFANNQFYRNSNPSNTTETNEKNRIWLDLVNSSGAVNRMLVGYISNATQAEDFLYDSFTDYKPSQNFYSLIGNDPMAIQGRTLPFDVNDKVNLGVTIPQNGTYKIAISATDGLFETTNQNIYLEDKVTNIIHDLRQNPYSFTADAGNHPTRFILRYTNETLGIDDLVSDQENLFVISSEALSVKSTKTTIKSVRVFDVLGRNLAYYPNVDSYEIPLTTIQKNNAGLIIQVTLSNGTIINKKAIY